MQQTVIVEGPNGLRVEFPAGTDRDTMNRVMMEAYQRVISQTAPQEQAASGMKPWEIPDASSPHSMQALERALVNADKAGDVSAAKTLAKEILRQRAEFDPSAVPGNSMKPWEIPDAQGQTPAIPSNFRLMEGQSGAGVPQNFRLLEQPSESAPPQQPQPSNGGFEEFQRRFNAGEIRPVNEGSTLADMGNQFRKGLVQGAGALISTPASIGRWLGDRANDGLDWMTGTDTSADRARIAETYGGGFLDPVRVGEAISNSTGIGDAATTAGDYANTIGQFLPGIFMGGPTGATLKSAGATMGPMATAATTGAVGSEAAGQATEGSAAEPYARVIGALAGVTAPGVARRIVTPNPMTAERRTVVDALKREGVKTTAGQQTGSKALRYLESELGGGKAANIMEAQAEQFTKAAAAKAGIKADRLTPDVMDNAFRSIGSKFDDLVSRTDIPLDAKLQDDLLDAVTEYQSVAATPAGAAEQIMGRVSDLATKNNGILSGEAYKNVSSEIARYMRSAGADPALKEALRTMKDALDNAVERGLSGDLLKQWRGARNEYRNLLVLEDAVSKGGERAAEGLLSPSQFRQSVLAKQGKRNYVRGEGDFAELARAGEAVMKALPDSGTASRSAARSLYTGIPGAIGAGIGSPGGPMGAIVGALLGAGVPYAAGRALLSRPVQAYLVNQLMRGGRNGSKVGKALVGGAGASAGILNSRD